MPPQSTMTSAKQAKPKPRKFYGISYSLRHGLADFEVENIEVLLMGALALFPPEGDRGFPAYPEVPRVVIGKRGNGPLPSDIELFHSYWLISDRLKRLFESLDPDAFAFQPCEVTLRNGSPGPVHWLCHVVRIIEAFGRKTMDEIEAYRQRSGYHYMGFAGRTELEFNEDAIGSAHIFRTPYSRGDVFCDQSMKDACKAAGLKGVAFRDYIPRRKRAISPPPPRPVAKPLGELRERLLACGDAAKSVSLAVAARSVLRAIPLLARLSWDKPLRKRMRPSLGRLRKSNSNIVLGCFRSAATAWVAALSPEFGASERFHAIRHEARMAGGAEDAGSSPAASVGVAGQSAMMLAISVFDKSGDPLTRDESGWRESCALFASQATAIVSFGFLATYDPPAAEGLNISRDLEAIANRELSEPERAVWDASAQDIWHWDSTRDTRELLIRPLWPAAAPPYAHDDWENLTARLRGRAEEHWQTWIDWYEARLAGVSHIAESDEIARVSLADEIWAQGAAAVNAVISVLAT